MNEGATNMRNAALGMRRGQRSGYGSTVRGLFVASCALALIPLGCTVGPNYQRPNVSVPGQFSEAATRPSSQPATEPPSQWWRQFNDPQLTSLVDRAVQSNLDLRLASARIREARAQYGVETAAEYPNVNLDGTYSRSRRSLNGTFSTANIPSSAQSSGVAQSLGSLFKNESDLYQAGFDASWEIDVFGRVRRTVESAGANVQAAEENRRDVLVSLTAEVVRNYIDLRGYQRQWEIAQENVRIQRDTLKLTQDKFNAGLRDVTELDVQRAKAQVASTESYIPSLEIAMRQTAHRLSVLLGQEPGALLGELVAPKPIPSGFTSQVPIGQPTELLRRRPDIRRAEAQLHAATARIGVATADLYPRFSLTGSFGFQSQDSIHLFDYNSRFWSMGPAVSWNIFDANRIRSNIRVQNARQEQAVITYEQAVLNALQDVENSLIAYNREQVRYRSLQDAVAADRRSVELAKARFDGGLTGFIDVLDAQRSQFLAEDQLVVSERMVAENLVALYKALGGGWEPPAMPPADSAPKQR